MHSLQGRHEIDEASPTYFILFDALHRSEKLSEDKTIFDDIVPNFIDEAILAHTEARIAVGRQETQNRVRPHLENMSAYLDAFETAGDS